ncbi:hypothetical protein [Streptomyces sp. TRM68367]|uniref:hypothetical protein n=1 Tax=Streptomyces sp. TRM68367 TaxID=2758415 RepID=UPI0021CEDF73|nr:hypothetical protein [Streptomyces sp. TRM68367]
MLRWLAERENAWFIASPARAHAVTGPSPGTATWTADRVLGKELPDPASAAPGHVASFFTGLSASAHAAGHPSSTRAAHR